VVDSNAGSDKPSVDCVPVFLRISDPNIGSIASSERMEALQNGTLETVRLKERFLP
jgi:hypothetical protein